MSATIFKIKIISLKKQYLDEETLLKYCFTSPKRSFRYGEYLQTLGVDLSNEATIRRMPHERFVTLLSENKHSFTLDTLVKIDDLKPYLSENIDSYYAENQGGKLIHLKSLVLNNILASLQIENFKKQPVTKLVIELAQDHDGIEAFPNHRGLGIISRTYRDFMLRVLAEIEEGLQPTSNKLANWLTNNHINIHPEYPNYIDFSSTNNDVGVDGIIWGIKEEREIIIESDTTDFTTEYKGSWWLDRIQSNFEYWKKHNTNWTESNKEYPFKIKTLSILLHPAWLEEIEGQIDLEVIYDSTAYGH